MNFNLAAYFQHVTVCCLHFEVKAITEQLRLHVKIFFIINLFCYFSYDLVIVETAVVVSHELDS